MDKDSFLFKALEYYGNHFHHRGKWVIHNYLRYIFSADINEELIVERNGLKWLLNPSDYVHRDVFWYGSKDYWDIFHICNVLKYDDVIFDIGANFGYYTMFLTKYLRNKCKVYAFEPFPTTFQRLTKNVALNNMNDSINIYQMGVSGHSGHIPISVRVPNNSGSATFSTIGHHRLNSIEVDVTSLDEFIEENKIRKIDFIKIDVEGYEPRVINGSKKLLKTFNPLLLLEIDPPLLIKAKSSVGEIEKSITDYGYKMFCAKRDKLVPFCGLNNNDTYKNVLCMRPEHIKLYNHRRKQEGIEINENFVSC